MLSVNTIQPIVSDPGRGGVRTPSAPVVAAPTVAAAAPLTSPSVSLDPALGVVVVECYYLAGNKTFSMPSQAILKAYRVGNDQPPGTIRVTAGDPIITPCPTTS